MSVLERTLTDAEAMGRTREGDWDAFALLVARHHLRLVRYLARLSGSRESGEELAQDLDRFFEDPAIARRAVQPADVATCGAVVIRPGEKRLDSVWGIPGDSPWESFQL